MTVTIKGTTDWAELESKNELSGKYQVHICNLSDAAVAALEDIGVEALEKEERGRYITCKSTRPIYAYGTEGESLQGIPVGNGSKVVAKVGSFEWKFKNKTGTSPSLNKLIVTELEIYTPPDDESPDMDEAL